MKSLVLLTTLAASLQATGELAQGLFSAPEPVLIALWGITLLTLAPSARNTLARLSGTKNTN